MFGGLAHEPAYRWPRGWPPLLPGELDHVFFAESGSVAVEIAMKMALQYWINRGVPGAARFVAFRGGYHGDTARRDDGAATPRRACTSCSRA